MTKKTNGAEANTFLIKDVSLEEIAQFKNLKDIYFYYPTREIKEIAKKLKRVNIKVDFPKGATSKIAEPQDAEHVLKKSDRIDGFFGASSIERLATERAIKAQTESFTRIVK